MGGGMAIQQWINQNFNGTTALILVILLSFVQIAPINLNPWSAIAKCLGKALNGEITDKVDKLGKELETFRADYDEKEAFNCRTRILRFNDELIHGTPKHTKEHFDQIKMDIDAYEKYCKYNEDFRNGIAKDAIERIERVYKECGDKGTFL